MIQMPLLSFKAFRDFLPDEFRQYIRDLRSDYVTEQEAKKEKRKLAAQKKPTGPIDGISFRINPKGTPILTIRRKPQWISPTEIDTLAKHYGFPQNEMWLLVKSRGIDISTTKVQTDIKEIPW